MKAICTKTHLQEASILSEKICGKNITLPILSAVLVSTRGKNLVFSSTNLEMGLEVTIPAKIEKEGSVAIPAKLLSLFFSSLSDKESINIEKAGNNLLVTTNNSSTTMKGYPIEDFPVLPKIKEKKSFIVSVNDFVGGLKSVYYSASLSEIKPEINSVCVFCSSKNPLTFVATDSFRLSEKKIQYKFSNSFSFLFPHRAAVEIIRIFEGKEGDLKIMVDDNNIVFLSSFVRFTSRLIEGVFPDYQQLIPTKFTNTVTIDKKQLTNALKTAITFSGRLNELKIRMYEGENFIEIQTNNPDLGEHIMSVVCKSEGGNFSSVFNYRYLTDCLPLINSEKITFKFGGEGRPLLVSGLDDNSFSCLIMPMKDV